MPLTPSKRWIVLHHAGRGWSSPRSAPPACPWWRRRRPGLAPRP